jgi:DNA-binding NarL/FixJ family response regulator
MINSMHLVREELRRLLGDQPDIQLVAEAEDNDAGLGLVAELSPDVVVIDFQKPLSCGAETVGRMLAIKPDLKIIALSMHSDRRYIHKCLQAGVCGYILKDCACEELIDAVRAVASNRMYLSRDIGR